MNGSRAAMEYFPWDASSDAQALLPSRLLLVLETSLKQTPVLCTYMRERRVPS